MDPTTLRAFILLRRFVRSLPIALIGCLLFLFLILNGTEARQRVSAFSLPAVICGDFNSKAVTGVAKSSICVS